MDFYFRDLGIIVVNSRRLVVNINGELSLEIREKKLPAYLLRVVEGDKEGQDWKA